jgi:hypothetical protein
MSWFRTILGQVFASGLREHQRLFDLCIKTCEQQAGSRYWECVELCHRHFNEVMPYEVEAG